VVDSEPIGPAVRILVDEFLRQHPSSIEPEFPARIEALASNIMLWGSKMNLTAHPEDPEELAFHLIDSVMPMFLVAGEFRSGRTILDLGSGAGFPGLVLAAASPAHFTLVEGRRKRASFLNVAMAEMGLQNVVIENRRAEEIGLEGQYDLVTARAFGDAAAFFDLAARALKRGGLAMLYASPSQRVLDSCQRVAYNVTRRGQRVDRILALQRRE
jgi:16S rRNA (guanine527-N7)-methyltransferase